MVKTLIAIILYISCIASLATTNDANEQTALCCLYIFTILVLIYLDKKTNG